MQTPHMHISMDGIMNRNENAEKSSPFFCNALMNIGRSGAEHIMASGYECLLTLGKTLIVNDKPEDIDAFLLFASTAKWEKIIGDETVLSLIPGIEVQNRGLMILRPEHFRKAERDERLMVLRTEDDYRKLFTLYREVPEMAEGFDEEDDEDNAERFISAPFPFTAVGICENGRIISGAYLSSVSRTNAMIVGTATAPEYRNRGFATSVISEIADISFNENLMDFLLLWYSSDKAGNLYRKIGFEDIPSIKYAIRRKT